MIEVEVFKDLEAASRAAADLCVEEYGKTSGLYRVALSGGSTPERAYEMLSAAMLDWQRVHLYWVDERYVPPDHPQSNELLARRSLIDRIGIPAANVHPMYKPGGPEGAARAYAQIMMDVKLHFAFMGIGADGHCASLFPGDEMSLHSEELALHTLSPAGIADRVTLTPLALRGAALVYLVHGKDKAPAVRRILAGETLPPKVLDKVSGRSVFLIDEEVAAEY